MTPHALNIVKRDNKTKEKLYLNEILVKSTILHDLVSLVFISFDNFIHPGTCFTYPNTLNIGSSISRLDIHVGHLKHDLKCKVL